MRVPLQTDHVREANRHGVFRALLAAGVASRATLAQRTGLSVPTVATILQEFNQAGLVREVDQDGSTGGRPAQRVALAPDARHVLALDLSGRSARALRVDLLGRIVRSDDGPVLGPGGEDALIAWLRDLIRPAQGPKPARLAVAVPGVVDPVDGHVDLAPALGWHDFALADVLERALGLPVTLENDVNALALAELCYGAGAGHDHVVYVAIGSGVGAGLVIHGQLYRGAHAAAGEIGYAITPPGATASTAAHPTSLPEQGPPPASRSGGPFERDLLALSHRFVGSDGLLLLDDVAGSADFERFAEGLRVVLHNLACALDPELLVVAWSADRDGILAERLRQRWTAPSPLSIVAGALGVDAAARGVARLALVQVEDDLCRHPSRDGMRTASQAAKELGSRPLSLDRSVHA